MKISKLIKALNKKIENKHAIYGINLLKIKKNLKSIRILGTYSPSKKTININKKLYKVNKKKYKEIIIHEYGHFICDLLFGNSVYSHGKEWKQIMRDLGVKDPKATTVNFSKEIKKAYPSKFMKVTCKCSIYNISIYKRKKFLNNKCPNCHKKFRVKK